MGGCSGAGQFEVSCLVCSVSWCASDGCGGFVASLCVQSEGVERTPVVARHTVRSALPKPEDSEGRAFAVVALSGTQYKVTPGDVVATDKVAGAEVGTVLELDEVRCQAKPMLPQVMTVLTMLCLCLRSCWLGQRRRQSSAGLSFQTRKCLRLWRSTRWTRRCVVATVTDFGRNCSVCNVICAS